MQEGKKAERREGWMAGWQNGMQAGKRADGRKAGWHPGIHAGIKARRMDGGIVGICDIDFSFFAIAKSEIAKF